MSRAVERATAARSTSSGVDAKSSGRRRDEIGRVERPGTERAHDLRDLLGLARARRRAGGRRRG